MKTYNKFDLEAAMLQLYQVCRDIPLVLSTEERDAALKLHELRCDEAFEILDDLVMRGRIQ